MMMMMMLVVAYDEACLFVRVNDQSYFYYGSGYDESKVKLAEELRKKQENKIEIVIIIMMLGTQTCVSRAIPHYHRQQRWKKYR